MPSTYAHYRFGDMMLKRLPEPMRRRLEANRGLYDLGLHGPDILFFYHPLGKNPVSGEGNAMHDRPGRVFFEMAAQKLRGMSGAARAEAEAYIFGYLCHFSLDSAAHTYVELRKKQTGISHTEIECEFDRRLMEKDGCPKRFPMAHIIKTPEAAARILPFYQGVTQAQVLEALKSMCFYGHILDARNPLMRWLVRDVVGGRDKSGELPGWFATGHNPKCDETYAGLLECFDRGLALAEKLMPEFENVLNGTAALGSEYDRTFGAQEEML